MITVGLINELHFLSRTLKTPIYMALKSNRIKHVVDIQIKDDTLNVFYFNEHIWKEVIGTAKSMFGIESCATIARIIFMIDSGGDVDWRKFIYIEK